MSNKSKAIGTRFESALVAWLTDRLGDGRIHRKALAGSKDEGDIGGVFAHGMEGVIEAKNHKRLTRSLVDEFRRQTLDERDNADADFAVLALHIAGRGATPDSPTFALNEAHVTFRDLARLSGERVTPEDDEHWAVLTLADLVWLLRYRPSWDSDLWRG